MLRRSLFIGALAAALMVPQLVAAAEFAWRMAVLYPRSSSYAPAYERFAQKVETMSGGRMTIQIVYDGEGVQGGELLSAVRNGLVELGHPFQALHAGEYPAGIVELGLPGGPSNLQELLTLFYKGGWIEANREAYAEIGIRYLAPSFQLPVYTITREPVKSLADFQNMKIRAPAVYGRFLRSFGVSPVLMPFAEVYTSLATGVLDGYSGGNLIDIRDGQFVEQVKHIFPVPLTYNQVCGLIANLDAFNGLPDDLKAILETAALEQGIDQATISQVEEQKALQEILAKGGVMTPMPGAEELAKWKEAAEALWPEYAAADPASAKLVELQRTFMAQFAD